jgi:hypothetical protein
LTAQDQAIVDPFDADRLAMMAKVPVRFQALPEKSCPAHGCSVTLSGAPLGTMHDARQPTLTAVIPRSRAMAWLGLSLAIAAFVLDLLVLRGRGKR